MDSTLLLYLLELVIAIGIMILIVTLIGVIIYDIIQAPYARQFARHIKQPLRLRPHVTVIIYIKDYILGLEHSISSVEQNRYKHYDIVVADNGSGANVRSQTRAILRQFGEKTVYYANRRHVKDEVALRNSYKRSKQGEIIVILQPSQLLPKQGLKRIVLEFTILPSLAFMRIPLSAPDRVTIESSLRQLTYVSYHLFLKAASLVTKRRKLRLACGVAVRRKVLLGGPGNQNRYAFESSLTVEHPRPYFLRRHTASELLVGLIASAFIILCALLSALSDLDQPFLIVWAVATGWIFFALILNENYSIATKVQLALSAPISIFIYVALTIINVIRFILGTLKPIARSFARN